MYTTQAKACHLESVKPWIFTVLHKVLYLVCQNRAKSKLIFLGDCDGPDASTSYDTRTGIADKSMHLSLAH